MPYKDPEVRRAYYKERRKVAGDAMRATANAWIKRNYARKRFLEARRHMVGITQDVVDSGINGVCEICGVKPLGQGHGKREVLAIDHDHLRQEFRGFLCMKCNRGLGLFCDDPEKLMSAARYLMAKRKVND